MRREAGLARRVLWVLVVLMLWLAGCSGAPPLGAAGTQSPSAPAPSGGGAPALAVVTPTGTAEAASGTGTAPVVSAPRPATGTGTAPVVSAPRPATGTGTAPVVSTPRPATGTGTAPVVSAPRPATGTGTAPVVLAPPLPAESPGVVVLMYHHLIRAAEGPEEPGVITVERLESHLKMMLDEGYRLISPAAFTAYLEGRLRLSGPSVLITFDDGYESNYVYALPMFKRYGVPAVIFPVMKFFHSQGVGAWSPHLVREHAELMRRSGLFLFGGHTYDGHGTVPTGPGGLRRGPWLATRAWLTEEKQLETDEEYRARIRADLERTVETLRQIGERDQALHFALPNGAHSPIALEELRRAGFRYIYTTDGSKANRPSVDLIYRVDAGSPHASVEWLKGKLESLLGKGR